MNKLVVGLLVFVAMAIFALVNASIPESVPPYKKTTGYKMGYQDGSGTTAGIDCFYLQADFNRRKKAWLVKDMSNNYLQGCVDAQNKR